MGIVTNTHWVPEHGLQIEETAQAGDKNGIFNLFRYWWAMILAKHANPGVIWDLGCGCGYGDRILVADEVTRFNVLGFDCDREATTYALRHFKTPRTAYANMNLDEPFTLPDGMPPDPVKMVTCFHLIEFLSNRDIFLNELCRHMSDDGIALFSTPIRPDIDLKPQWDKQRVNFSMSMFKSVLGRYFKRVMDITHPKFPGGAFKITIQKKLDNAIEVGNDLVFCQHPIRLKPDMDTQDDKPDTR